IIFRLHQAAMCSAYRLNNRQTETSSFDRAKATRIGPEEPLKNVWQIAGRDSRAGIGDLQLSLPVRYIYPTMTLPPSGVYLIALSKRFTTTCLRRTRSPSTSTRPCAFAVSTTRFSSANG